MRYICQGPAGAVAEHLAFVVIHRDPGGLLHEPGQFLPIEHGQALAGVKHEGNACRHALSGMFQHGIPPIGRDDRYGGACTGLDAKHMGLHHGAGMKCRDLIVVAVRHDHGLGGVRFLYLAHVAAADAECFQALEVVRPVAAQHRHGKRLAPQQLQAVGNIASAASKITPQRWHQERNVQDVQLVGQDLLGKAALESHDGVECQGTTNERSHIEYGC